MVVFHTFFAVSLLAVPAVFLVKPSIRQLTAGAPRAEGHASGAHTPIVFVILDELTLAPLLDAGGRVDAEVFPRLATFTGEATFFTNAATASGATAATTVRRGTGSRAWSTIAGVSTRRT